MLRFARCATTKGSCLCELYLSPPCFHIPRFWRCLRLRSPDLEDIEAHFDTVYCEDRLRQAALEDMTKIAHELQQAYVSARWMRVKRHLSLYY